ncbi:MAG: hypothetical protein N0C82_19725 [Candidatus Thiodiazotropha endolucinida]|nr:hypothetical protein [Candidatus Thiodiazotropha taylori]MCG8121839.1 hypothetical protein [Candidatus Thiodiazotropha taylori]MCW4250845.1 hypothetical protein [Candidatus Thiodiazotropha endolucinida]MCW4297535.1 hypothetical protein [Candidatus Thiodiazotropha endolucinida]MCW4320387.1 hypothetical protein [Candidatus Thiodiazotropha taylori]
MKIIAMLIFAVSIVGCSTGGQPKEKENEVAAEDAFKVVCQSCWVVASHINHINPDVPMLEIAKTSEEYAYRMAIKTMCEDCYSILASKEKAQDRLFSTAEAKQYFESEEYATSMASLISQKERSNDTHQ